MSSISGLYKLLEDDSEKQSPEDEDRACDKHFAMKFAKIFEADIEEDSGSDIL
jgi:hypothetical protein